VRHPRDGDAETSIHVALGWTQLDDIWMLSLPGIKPSRAQGTVGHSVHVVVLKIELRAG